MELHLLRHRRQAFYTADNDFLSPSTARTVFEQKQQLGLNAWPAGSNESCFQQKITTQHIKMNWRQTFSKSISNVSVIIFSNVEPAQRVPEPDGNNIKICSMVGACFLKFWN